MFVLRLNMPVMGFVGTGLPVVEASPGTFSYGHVAEGFSGGLPRHSAGQEPSATRQVPPNMIFYNKGGGAPPKRIATADGRLVRLREDGAEVNGKVTPYYMMMAQAKPFLRENAHQGEIAIERFLNMHNDVEKHGTYEDLLKFTLLITFADTANARYFTQLMDWLPRTLLDEVRDRFARQFANAPLLPIEHGIWTELVTAYSRFKSGKLRAEVLDEQVGTYLFFLKDKIAYSDSEITFGPLTLTHEDFLAFFEKTVDAVIERCRKNTMFKRDREFAALLLQPNVRAKKWLKRADIPDKTKTRLALIKYLDDKIGEYSDVFQLFKTDEFADAHPLEAETRVNELYERQMSPRIKGVASPVAKPPEQRQHQSWRIVPLVEMTHEALFMRNPDISYSFIKMFDYYLTALMIVIRRGGREYIAEGDFAPEVRIYRDRVNRVNQFLKDPKIERDIKGMVMDLCVQDLNMKVRMVGMVANIIDKYISNPNQLAQEIKKLYYRNVPYAEALFLQLASEKAKEQTPEAVTVRLLQKMENEPEEVRSAWLKARSKPPAHLQNELVEIMQKAITASGISPVIYRPWMLRLGGLSFKETDWQWLEGASEKKPHQLVRLLQDVTYPYDEHAKIDRPAQNLSELTFIPDNKIWADFISATAFLTPDEWEAMTDTLQEIIRETKEASRYFRSKNPSSPLPESIEERKAVQNPDFFHRAIKKITLALRRGFGKESAVVLRKFLRESVGDTDSLFALMRLSTLSGNSHGLAHMGTVLSKVDEMQRLGIVGDIANLAGRLLFPSDGNEQQAAKAEYTAAVTYVNEGFVVEILPPDISTRKRTPDLVIQHKEGGLKTPVEVKSRQMNGLDTVSDAIYTAASQIENKIRRSVNMERGIVALYLIGNGNETKEAIVLHIQLLLKNATPGTPLSKVEAVHLHFIENGNWDEKEWFEIKN